MLLGFRRCLLAFSLVPLVSASAEPPQDGNLQESVYQQDLAQESIRKQADKIQAQLAALIEGMKLNGLDPAALSSLSSASSRLSSLNQGEMQEIINALQGASLASDDPKRRDGLMTAYEEQKDLVLKFKALSARMAIQEISSGLIAQLENLIARQTSNLRHTKEFAATGESGEDRKQTLQKIIAAEQASIEGEIDLLFSTLPSATAPASPPSVNLADDGATLAQAVLEAANNTTLKADAAEATRLTGGEVSGGAWEKENAVREGLITILSAALAKQDATTRFEHAKTQLDQVVDDQQSIAEATNAAKLDAATLAERQAQVDDHAEVAKVLLKSLQPAAAAQVTSAQEAIAQSAEALADAKRITEAVAKQQLVAQALAAAQQLLAKQMAVVQSEQNQSPVDKLNAIQKALDEIKQAQALTQSDAQQAAKLAAQAQQDALPQSPEAAEKAGEAADKLQQPAPDTAAANQALAQASDALQKEKDSLTQAAQDYQALANASQQLAQAQQNAAAADQSMQGASNNFTQAAKDLTQASNDVNQTQQQAQKSGAPQDAQQALQQAGDALKNATNQAVQAKGEDAKAQNQSALAAMQKAQTSLGQAMAKISAGGANNPGGKSDGPSSLPGTGAPASMNDSPISGGSGGGTLAGVGASNGPGFVVGGLTPKDRAAINQYQAEKSPPEYSSMIQQYLKNLANSNDGP